MFSLLPIQLSAYNALCLKRSDLLCNAQVDIVCTSARFHQATLILKLSQQWPLSVIHGKKNLIKMYEVGLTFQTHISITYAY
jgi:hypothetical protein